MDILKCMVNSPTFRWYTTKCTNNVTLWHK